MTERETTLNKCRVVMRQIKNCELKRCAEWLRHKGNKRTKIVLVPLGHFSGGKSGTGNESGPAKVQAATVPDPVAFAHMTDLYGFPSAHRF